VTSDENRAALAQTLGRYRERAAVPCLRGHFARVWVHRLPAAPAGRPILVVPDGCVDLQWFEGTLRIAGPDRGPQREMPRPGSTVVGLRFRAGAAASWLGVPACELVDRRVPLEAFWGAQARRIAEAAGETRGLPALVEAIETALAPRAAATGPADPRMRAAFGLLRTGAPTGGQTVRWLAGELGTAERTLRRRFHEAFGFGPKTLDGILRFQRFLRLARAGTGTLAALAADAGYADQAHLARECRRFATATPSEVAAALAGEEDVAVPFKTPAPDRPSMRPDQKPDQKEEP
jgi:AraC-like DNA-binding protein